jgi:hypothetical protein
MPAVGHPVHLSEEMVGLAGGESRCRLVERDNAGVAHQRAGQRVDAGEGPAALDGVERSRRQEEQPHRVTTRAHNNGNLKLMIDRKTALLLLGLIGGCSGLFFASFCSFSRSPR